MTSNIKSSKFISTHSREIIAATAFMLTYAPTFLWMWDRWFVRDSYYSHGVLIPFVTGFLIWYKRAELAQIRAEKSPWGIWLIAVGILIHMVSSVLRVYFTSGLSMLMVLVGLILYFYGKNFLKQIVFPIIFLIFMIPAPLVVIANVSFKMKIFAAQIATVLLNHMRLPAIREGSLIKMQHAYVMVDDVCSGLRSLISLTALGSLFAYWMKSTMTKRVILLISTIPIAIITNVARIIFLSGISEIWGPQHATGFIHDFSGFMVFGLAFILLLAVEKILQ